MAKDTKDTKDEVQTVRDDSRIVGTGDAGRNDPAAGLPASQSGKAVQEASPEVRRREMGVTGTEETVLAGLGGAAPIVDHDEAARDEAERQAADDNRRRNAREAEEEARAAQERAHRLASPQFDDDGNALYDDLGRELDKDGNLVEVHPAEVEDKRKRL